MAEETTTAAPPANTTAAPPANTTAAPPANTTAAPPANTTAAPPANTTTTEPPKTPPADDWRASIDDEKLRDHAGRFTSPKQLAQAHLDLRTKLSSAIIVPGEKATDEERADYRKKLGIPETPEGYKFPEVPADQLTDEVKAERAAWAKFFHDNGVSAKQAEALINQHAAVSKAILDKQKADDEAHAEASEEALRKEWKGDEYDRNRTFANRAFQEVANRAGLNVDELRQMEGKDGRFIFDDPRMVRIFAMIGREMGEGNLGPVVSENSRTQIETQISDTRNAITAAQQKGDSKEANRLYQHEQKLLAQLHGNRPVVGSMGRAA